MSVRLICLRGPLGRATFPIVEGGSQWTFGRESSNRVELPDLEVSRSHAVLCQLTDRTWQINDLNTTNGTFVNGKRIRSHRLSTGDHLAIGSSIFLFLDHEEEGPGEVEVDSEAWQLRTTLNLREPESWVHRSPTAEYKAHLENLSHIATALNGWQSLEGLQRDVLRLVLQSVPADHGAVLALDPTTGATGAVYGWRRSGRSAPVTVSRSVIDRVFADREAVLCRFDSGSSTPSKSILSARIQSLIVAPMITPAGVVGALCLDTVTGTAPLAEESLQFAAAVGAMAAQPLESARRIDQLEADKQRLEADLGRAFNMIGDSPAMQRVYQSLERVAASDSTVLILGETGSGKELAARAVHRGSRRATGPFVAINCAAIAENLLESELFGHERGAFTGAAVQKRGKLELAHNGTLFLDEVGELPLSLQAKLLRALQEREFDRVGGTRPVRVDLRVVAATNRDLQASVSEGRFRQDLYYRLNVVSLAMPPLRERGTDIFLLATDFLSRMAPSVDRMVKGFSPSAKAALLAYHWPGNVRELQNTIERALVLGSGEWIERDDLADEIVEMAASETTEGTFHARVLEAKQEILRAALAQCGGKYVEAARVLGIHVKHLHRLMTAYGLKGTVGNSSD